MAAKLRHRAVSVVLVFRLIGCCEGSVYPYRLFASVVAGTAARIRLIVGMGLPTATGGVGSVSCPSVSADNDSTDAAGLWAEAPAATSLRACSNTLGSGVSRLFNEQL